jgi:hypothetical protein
VTWIMWNLISVRLETLLVSVQDRCTVCAKCTIGSEIVLDAPWRQIDAWFASNVPLGQKSFLTHPLELIGDKGHLESCFCPLGDSVCVGVK